MSHLQASRNASEHRSGKVAPLVYPARVRAATGRLARFPTPPSPSQAGSSLQSDIRVVLARFGRQTTDELRAHLPALTPASVLVHLKALIDQKHVKRIPARNGGQRYGLISEPHPKGVTPVYPDEATAIFKAKRPPKHPQVSWWLCSEAEFSERARARFQGASE